MTFAVRRRVRSPVMAALCTTVLLGALAAPAASAVERPGVASWTVSTRFAPAMGDGIAVACPTRRYCDAIEYTTSGLAAVRGTTDGGTSWHTELTAPPGVYLDAIACASRAHCVAIDGESSLRAFWTDDAGRRWRASPLPPTVDFVVSATCVQSGACAATGLDTNGNPVLLETDDQGARWYVHAIDPAIDTNDLFVNLSLGVACVTWRDCIVGQRGAVPPKLFVTRDGGRDWRTVALPRGMGALTSLGCTRAGHCAVAGANGLEGTVATSGDDGQTWRLTLRTGSVMGYYAVACTERGACLAAGATRDRFLVVARSTDGSTWHEADVAAPQLSIAPFLSCAAARCTIVAAAASGVAMTDGTANLGRTWATEDVQHVPDEPTGVACPTAGTCELVGYAADGPFAERTTDDGATFTRQPLPAGIDGLRGIACATALDCQAIGVSVDPIIRFVLLGTTNGGSSWTEEAIPSSVASVTGIACPSPTTCVAVGISKMLETATLATTDGGSTWTAGSLSGVKESLAEATSVTCSSATTCVAGLFAIPTPGFLVTTDAGASWTFSPSEPESESQGSFGPIPLTVSCASATACVAIAENLFGGGLSVLVSSDGGATWTAEEVLGAELDQSSPLECHADGACEVVAADELTSRSYLLTSSNDGVSWSSSPMPSGWLISIALSCPSPTSCFSVGIEADGGYAYATSS